MDNDGERSTRGQRSRGSYAAVGRAATLVDPHTHAESQIGESQSTSEATRERYLEISAKRFHVESLQERVEGFGSRWPSEAYAGK